MKRQMLIAALAAAFSAHASDGVIEINHAKVAASGGYPYTINQPGSYRLTSNLHQPTATTDVIDVESANVTIDLNGFAITGNNSCSFNAASSSVICQASAPGGVGTGVGINFTAGGAAVQGRVRNGSIRGVGSACIVGADLVEDVAAESCGSAVGIQAATVRRVSVASSGVATGIQAYRVIDSSAIGNGGVGIDGATEVASSRAEANVGDGILIAAAGSVRNSSSVRNLGHGIRVNGGLVSGNYVENNLGAGIYVANATATSLVGNVALANGVDPANNKTGYCGIQFSTMPTAAAVSQNVVNRNGASNPNSGEVFTICDLVRHAVTSVPANSNLCNGSAC